MPCFLVLIRVDDRILLHVGMEEAVHGKLEEFPQYADGHGKAEYIFSLIISVITILLSVKIFSDGVDSLINGSKFIFSTSLVVVCLVTILTKLCMYLYTNKIFKKTNNI